MGQLIVVYIIGAIALIYIAVRLYKVFFRGESPCADCKGCELQSILKDSTKFKSMTNDQRSLCDENRDLTDKKRGGRSTGKGSNRGCCG